MPMRTRRASLPARILIAGVAAALVAASPAIFGLTGWSGGHDLARFDPLLSLCLASRPGVTPQRLWASWSLAPQIVLPLLLATLLYGRGVLAGRSPNLRRPKPMQIGFFAGGMILLAAALLSPLCRLSATLASAHMIQHLLIVTVIPPLLIMGEPLVMLRQSVPVPSRAAPCPATGLAQSSPNRPTLATCLYGATIWLSHAPPIYEAALLDPTIHLLLLVVQLSAGLFFWQIIIRAASPGERGDGQIGAALLVAFVTLMHTGLLGALLTFSNQLWYPIYDLRPQAWGLTPLEDQQLAGLIMWMPMSVIYLAAGLAAIIQLLRVQEPRAEPRGHLTSSRSVSVGSG
jgi:putative membrane protein